MAIPVSRGGGRLPPAGRCCGVARRMVALVAALCLLAALRHAAGAAVPAQQARGIHLQIFLSKNCPSCDLVEEASLRRLSEKYGCTIVPHYYDVDSLDEYKRLVALERRMGDTGNELPVVFLGEHVLGGVAEIEARLEGLLVSYRETGLAPVDVPTVQEAEAALRSDLAGTDAARRLVRVAYFEEPGCRECARAERILKLARARYPRLEVRRFSTRATEDRVLLEVLCERAGVPPSRRLLVPAVFCGSKALVREDIGDAELDAAFADPANDTSAVVWEATEQERAAAQQRLWERSRTIGIAAVAAGGLVDGINPCAFATLVFFVCCLAGAGKHRRIILAMGVCFTMGVFAAYFLTGVVLIEALRGLDVLPWVSRVLTWGIIAGTFALAALSFWDFTVALRGRAGQMKLKLPQRLRMRINAIIARRLHARSVAIGAFGVGFTVSLLEFVCTGQVYLPLIRYMTTVAGTRLRGLGLLVVYDLAFVVPLLGVFAAAYLGLSSDRLMAGFRRHVALAKLLLAAFFLGLGALLLHTELGRIL